MWAWLKARRWRWLHLVPQDGEMFPRTGLFLEVSERADGRPELTGLRLVLGLVWPKARLFLADYENAVRWARPMLWLTAGVGFYRYMPWRNDRLPWYRCMRWFFGSGVSPIVNQGVLREPRQVRYYQEKP